MLRSDQLQISNTYNNMLLEKQINYELDQLYNNHLVNEGFLDSVRKAGDDAAAAVSSTINSASQSVDTITKLPEQLSSYFNTALPQYIDKLSSFLLTALESGAVGTVLTYTAGKLIMLLAKRISKETEQDYQAITAMLPDTVQEQIREIEGLKQTDPAKYRKMVFQINKNALTQLEKELVGTGKKMQRVILTKTLNFLGSALSSVPGSLAGGIAIAVIIQKLGFNPMPIFPNF